ncbi:hypothetical protein K2Q08_03630 [Patescibacteria group bacterium]|nr:hypothetical protein [Patescibacteria group bacterium]
MKWRLVLGIATGILFLLVISIVAYYQRPLLLQVPGIRGFVIEIYAHQVIASCAQVSYRPGCYDKEIPKLLDKGVSMEDAFVVTAAVQRRGTDYLYCHVLGHNLASKENAKDPTKWAQVIARCPVGQCASGCLHGVLFDTFEDKALTTKQMSETLPLFSSICENGNGRNFSDLEHYSCYHGLGHMALFVTGPVVSKALDLCERAATRVNQSQDLNMAHVRKCYEGLFMEIFQPLEPEDLAVVKDIRPHTSTEAQQFCDSLSGEGRAACYRESWPLYQPKVETSAGLKAFCDLVPGSQYEQDCYNVTVYSLTVKNNFNTEKMRSLCEGLPEKRKGQCLAHSASRFIETDNTLIPNAAAFCKVAEELGVGDRCYGELLFYSHFNYEKGTKEFNALCNALPGVWKGKCLAGEGANISPYVLDI